MPLAFEVTFKAESHPFVVEIVVKPLDNSYKWFHYRLRWRPAVLLTAHDRSLPLACEKLPPVSWPWRLALPVGTMLPRIFNDGRGSV